MCVCVCVCVCTQTKYGCAYYATTRNPFILSSSWAFVALAVYLGGGFFYNVAYRGLPLHASSIPHRFVSLSVGGVLSSLSLSLCLSLFLFLSLSLSLSFSLSLSLSLAACARTLSRSLFLLLARSFALAALYFSLARTRTHGHSMAHAQGWLSASVTSCCDMLHHSMTPPPCVCTHTHSLSASVT